MAVDRVSKVKLCNHEDRDTSVASCVIELLIIRMKVTVLGNYSEAEQQSRSTDNGTKQSTATHKKRSIRANFKSFLLCKK